MLQELRDQVCKANRRLETCGLITLTWGNVSGIDRDSGVILIKPSGVAYDRLTPENLVAVDMDGKTVEGGLNPSSDTPIHLALYRSFSGIGGVTHTHSTFATAFAQARKPIPCLGTTHADNFYGEVPVTRLLTAEEVENDYEANTGRIIVDCFRNMDPIEVPGVLVASHGPFTWGKDAEDSLVNSIALEQIAETACRTVILSDKCPPIPRYLLDKHFCRKHGEKSYYGQVS